MTAPFGHFWNTPCSNEGYMELPRNTNGEQQSLDKLHPIHIWNLCTSQTGKIWAHITPRSDPFTPFIPRAHRWQWNSCDYMVLGVRSQTFTCPVCVQEHKKSTACHWMQRLTSCFRLRSLCWASAATLLPGKLSMHTFILHPCLIQFPDRSGTTSFPLKCYNRHLHSSYPGKFCHQLPASETKEVDGIRARVERWH